MNAKNGFRMGGIQLIHGALLAEGVVQQGAHGSVGDEEVLAQTLVEIVNSHSSLLPLINLCPPYYLGSIRCESHPRIFKYINRGKIGQADARGKFPKNSAEFRSRELCQRTWPTRPAIVSIRS